MDRITTDSGMFQSKYQVLVRENEILKNKLREKSKEQYETSGEDRRGGGWRSWFRKD